MKKEEKVVKLPKGKMNKPLDKKEKKEKICIPFHSICLSN